MMKSFEKKFKAQEPAIPKTTLELIRRMAGPYKGKATLFFVLSFLGTLAWYASPLMIAELINVLSDSGEVTNVVWWLIWGYAGLRVIDEVLWRVSEVVMRSFKPQMVESVRWNLFAAIHKKPYAFFVNANSGRIGHWINQTVITTNEFVDTTIWTVWSRVIGLIISALFLLTVHWTIALIFVVWLVALFSYNVHRGKRFGELVAMQSDEQSKTAGFVVDSISNHVSVRVFGARHNESTMLLQQQGRIIRRWRSSWLQNLFTNIVKGQSAAIVSVLALVLVIVLYGNGTIQLGAIVLFVAYFGDASSSLWNLAWALDNYYRNFGTIQNALDGLQSEDERQVASQGASIPSQKAVGLDLENLRFMYPEQQNSAVLDGISLSIKPGEKVGVVGHSGAGKSTLVGLLLGFFEPTGGKILLNGHTTEEHGPTFIRRVSSFVPQDSNLFNRTVRENITYARPDASEKEIHDALKRAQAIDFVEKLPLGLETMIGERGVKLSGGQRQRLAIARAILQNAPLLILDEATSALDSVSEQAIQKALYELMKQRTSIVIAHRLSTLKHLDKIIVLEDGKIVEQGTHKELLKLNGMYADLWRRQKDGFVVE